MRKFLFIALLLIMYLCAEGQNTISKYESKRELHKDTKEILNEFDEYVKSNGLTLPYLPNIKTKSTPQIIYLDKRNRQIVLTTWERLELWQKDYFINLFGDVDEACKFQLKSG